jgi:hypothetical protein
MNDDDGDNNNNNNYYYNPKYLAFEVLSRKII